MQQMCWVLHVCSPFDLAWYGKRNGAKFKNYKLITFNEHNHIQRTRSHPTHSNTCTSNEHNHIQRTRSHPTNTITFNIQQTQSHSTLYNKFSHSTSTITSNKHNHIQQTRSHSTNAITFNKRDHIQASKSRSRQLFRCQQIP